MRQYYVITIITLFTFTACGQNHPKIQPATSGNMSARFDLFIVKEKFMRDSTIFYPGIADTALQPVLTKKINQAASDFRITSMKSNVTDKDYQEQIKKGLSRFGDTYLDTEDRGRVCMYFEELMDIVGLQSSGGLLNNFMYGFDPKDIKKKQ